MGGLRLNTITLRFSYIVQRREACLIRVAIACICIGPAQTYPFLSMRSINKTTTRYVSSVYRYCKTATWNILMRRYLEDDGLFFLFRNLNALAENSRGLFTAVEWVVVCWTLKLSLERSTLCPPKNYGVLTPKVLFSLNVKNRSGLVPDSIRWGQIIILLNRYSDKPMFFNKLQLTSILTIYIKNCNYISSLT